jgi:hypothetical protein
MTNKNKVKAEVGEMKEVKELVRPVVDVEEELLSAGYSVIGLANVPKGGTWALYTKDAKSPDELYLKLFSFLNTAEEALSVTGRSSFFQYDFKGSYTSQVIRSEEGEVVNVSHLFSYSFSAESPYGFSVSVGVTGELDAPAPKGNVVTCSVSPSIFIGPVAPGRWQKKKTKELVLKVSNLFAIRSIKFPEVFPEAHVFVVLEKTSAGRGGVEESLSHQYLGKAGEVFHLPEPDWSEDKDSLDEDYDRDEDDRWDSDP